MKSKLEDRFSINQPYIDYFNGYMTLTFSHYLSVQLNGKKLEGVFTLDLIEDFWTKTDFDKFVVEYEYFFLATAPKQNLVICSRNNEKVSECEV